MARIRTIKPEFFTSEDVVSLSPLARLLYIALWCEADREGRMVWKPRTFKLRYFPADQCDIEALCGELIAQKLVVLYGDGEFAVIPKFAKHQHINPRESASTIPEPVDNNASRTRRHASARVSDAQAGRERNGKEGDNPPTPQGGRFDEFWNAWPKHPRKAGRPQCERKWRSWELDGEADQILTALEAQKASAAWAKDGGEFIPAPLVWLNQRRWEAPTEGEAAAEQAAAHWHECRSGIEAKGAELGIGRWDEQAFSLGRGEPWPAYQARVFRAAGFEPRRVA